MLNEDLDRDLELESLEENVPKTVETEEKLNEFVATENKKENNRSANMFKVKDNDAETVKAFKATVNFVYYLACKMMGVCMNYYWEPLKHLGVYVTCGTLSFAWICFLNTQYRHIQNGELVRTLEVFAVYGIGLSVIFFPLSSEKYFLNLLFLLSVS